MSIVRLSRPRVIRTGHPLTKEQIESVAPAIYATEPHSGRSERYAYVPTFQVLETLQDNGFQIFEASQQRSRREDKDPYTKHMVRLRKGIEITKHGVPEIVLVNAHDGSASYSLFEGFFRFICSNGMIAGTVFGGTKVRHTIPEVTKAEVLTAATEVAKEFNDLMERIRRMSDVVLNREQQSSLAQAAVNLRYPGVNPPFDPAQLLDVRRAEDNFEDAWTVLNRIQENVTKGGFETRSVLFGRRSVVRPVERVSNVLRINQGLWRAAEELAEIG